MEHLQKLEYLTTNKASILSLKAGIVLCIICPQAVLHALSPTTCMYLMFWSRKKKNYLPFSKYAFIAFNLIPFFIHTVPEAWHGFLHYLSIKCLSILQSHLKYYFFCKTVPDLHNRV